jgi:cyclopropane fatty-acyl-phospholipid synthase-like methyltransferase
MTGRDESSHDNSKTQDLQDLEYSFPYHYVSQMPDTGFVQHFVDTWGINYISTIEMMLEALGQLDIQNVIDIGCGDGRLAREIHRRFRDLDVVAVDRSTRAISLAQAMNHDLPRIEFKAVDIATLASDRQFDAAILMEVYEHIPLEETHGFLAGVRRILKQGGVLLVTVPHSNKPLEYKHFQHFTGDTLIRDLSEHFEILELKPFERKSLMRSLLNRLLCNRLFVLNHAPTLRWLYAFYRRFLFSCKSEKQCQRLFVKAVVR